MKIIVISGKQGSGKTTLAKGLERDLGCAIMKFAEPLYDMEAAIATVLEYYGRAFKRPDGKLLQLLGTEWGREVLGQDVWADILKERLQAYARDEEGTCVIVDDCRFVNEFKLFQDMKAAGAKVLTVRLECPECVRKIRAEKWRDRTDHPSEIGLDDCAANGEFDLTLNAANMGVGEILFTVREKLACL